MIFYVSCFYLDKIGIFGYNFAKISGKLHNILHLEKFFFGSFKVFKYYHMNMSGMKNQVVPIKPLPNKNSFEKISKIAKFFWQTLPSGIRTTDPLSTLAIIYFVVVFLNLFQTAFGTNLI